MASRDPRPGVLYRDPAEPAGCLGFFVVDAAGNAVYRVQVAADRMTDELHACIEEAARLAAPPGPALRLI